MFERCPTCNKFDFLDRHKCLPAYKVWQFWDDEKDDEKELEEYAETVYAFGHEEAAEEWAEDDDAQGDYTIVGGSETKVKVKKVGEDIIKIFEVSGESIPKYSATEIKEGD
jgi:hypothetical protein